MKINTSLIFVAYRVGYFLIYLTFTTNLNRQQHTTCKTVDVYTCFE